MTAEWWVYLLGYGYSLFLVDLVLHLPYKNKRIKIFVLISYPYNDT